MIDDCFDISGALVAQCISYWQGKRPTLIFSRWLQCSALLRRSIPLCLTMFQKYQQYPPSASPCYTSSLFSPSATNSAVTQIWISSKECKDFLLQCWQKVPEKRPSAQQLLEHPWVASSISSLQNNDTDSSSQVSKEQVDGENTAKVLCKVMKKFWFITQLNYCLTGNHSSCNWVTKNDQRSQFWKCGIIWAGCIRYDRTEVSVCHFFFFEGDWQV